MMIRLIQILFYVFIANILLYQGSAEMSIYKKISSRQRFRLSLLQYLSPHYYHNMNINQTQYKCLTISPTILQDSPKKFNPKTQKIDYSIAQHYLKSLEGLCVQHYTKAFIYQYCHGGIARQFDDEITKYNNQKKTFENFVIGVTQNSENTEDSTKSQNLPQKTSFNQKYISPPNTLKKIDILDNSVLCYDWFYSYNQSIISFKYPRYGDPNRLQLYSVSCEKPFKNTTINFKLVGKAMSPFQLLVTDLKVPVEQHLKNQNQQISIAQFTSKDCLSVKAVHKYSTSPVQNRNEKNQIIARMKKQQLFQQDQQQKYRGEYNLFDPTTTMLNEQLYFRSTKEMDYMKTLHLDKQFLFGDFMGSCRYWQNQPDPFKVISFKVMPGSLIFLEVIDKNKWSNETHTVSLTVEQVVTKQILKVKRNQIKYDLGLKIIPTGGIAIRKCYILSNIKLQIKKLDPDVKFEKWGKLIKYQGTDNKNLTGKVYLCNTFFKIQIGNSVLKDNIYQGYSKYNFNQEKYFSNISIEKGCIQAEKIQANQQPIKTYKIQNSPNSMQILAHQGQQMQIDLSKYIYAIDMSYGTRIVFEIEDKQHEKHSTYLILYNQIYEIQKQCSKSKPNCTKIQQRVYLVKENSFYENQTELKSKTVYLKVIDNPIIKEHPYIGIWRSGDAQTLPRFQLRSTKGKITLKYGMAYVRVILKEPSKQIIAKSVLDHISQDSMSLSKVEGALITSTTLKGGELCGPQKIPREVVVKFKCGESLFKLNIVKQTAICKYEYTIETNKLCSIGLVKNYESSLFSKRQTVCTPQ